MAGNGTHSLTWFSTQAGFTNRTLFGVFCFSLLIFVFCYDLGFVPLDTDTDEARRAVVSAEMILSGDYIHPTINGLPFLNKPPLYNWIVVAFFKLTGGYSMFAFRLPVVLSILLTGVATFFVVKKFTNYLIAFFAAYAYMTNGRILIDDSLQGLIDATYSLVVYVGFMVVYLFGERKRYLALFVTSYLLCAAGFLLKGFPSLVFQGITLLVYFVGFDSFRGLFQWRHAVGIGVFACIVGGYYWCYFSGAYLAPGLVFANLLSESTQRTVVAYGWKEVVQHLFMFPMDFLYHFLPWTLFAVVLIDRHVLRYIRAHRFVRYNAWVFFFNVLVYWTSPQVFPRYLFMFVPLFFTVVFYLLFEKGRVLRWQVRSLVVAMPVICGIMLLLGLATLFIPSCQALPYGIWKSLLVGAGFGVLLWWMMKAPGWRFYAFLVAVLWFRMAFNWFVVEQRGEVFLQAEQHGHEVAAFTAGQPLYVLEGADVGIMDAISFHVALARNEVLGYAPLKDTGGFYIVDRKQLGLRRGRVFMGFPNYCAPDSLFLVRFESGGAVH